MFIIWVASGYDSWNNKQAKRAFKTLQEAKDYALTLTNPEIHLFSGKDSIKAINDLLGVCDYQLNNTEKAA